MQCKMSNEELRFSAALLDDRKQAYEWSDLSDAEKPLLVAWLSLAAAEPPNPRRESMPMGYAPAITRLSREAFNVNPRFISGFDEPVPKNRVRKVRRGWRLSTGTARL